MAERVYCLYRVSTKKQVDHTQENQADIPMQRKACREFAEGMGWNIIREEQETGVSGFKVSAEDRDKLQLIRDHAAQGKFDILLVFMLDRLGRKADETPFVVKWLASKGIQVWSVSEGPVKFESHVDDLLNYIRFWQADGESQKISTRVKVKKQQMAAEGLYSGGTVPYGYRLVGTGTYNRKKQEICRYAIEENEAAIIRLMFEKCVNAGYGKWKLASYLNELGIHNRTGGAWHQSTISHILHNQLYMGVLPGMDAESEPDPKLSIIEEATFLQAQELIEQRRTRSQEERRLPLNTRGQSLLSGNVFCGHCGGRLTLTTSGKVVRLASGETKGIKRIRYACYNKSRKRMDCDGQSGYTAHRLDAVVNDVIRRFLDQLGLVDEEKLTRIATVKSGPDTDALLRQALRRQKEAEQEYAMLKRETLLAMQGESKFAPDLLAEMTEEAIEKRRIAISQAESCRLEKKRTQQAAAEKRTSNERWSWGELFEQSDAATRKMIAAYLIRRVLVFRGYALCIEMNDLGVPWPEM